MTARSFEDRPWLCKIGVHRWIDDRSQYRESFCKECGTPISGFDNDRGINFWVIIVMGLFLAYMLWAVLGALWIPYS